MSEPSKLDVVLAESADEIGGYLRESLKQVALLAEKGLEKLDAGEVPIGVADRLFDHAKHILGNTDRLVTYEEIAEHMEETE